MLRTRVIPCLLLRGAGLVKTMRFKDPKYVGDPINAIRIFNDKEVDELVFLDITATVDGRKPNLKLISEIASECFMPLAYGGGVTTVDEIREILRLGVEKVVLNAAAVENPSLVEQAAKLFGSQAIVVSIDVKRNFWGSPRVFTRRGTLATGLDPVSHARRMAELGAGEIFLNSIDNDGVQGGFDLKLIRSVTSAVKVPVIACGGAGKIGDFISAVKEGGASAVAAGSLFVFHGKFRSVLISYPDIAELEKSLT